MVSTPPKFAVLANKEPKNPKIHTIFGAFPQALALARHVAQARKAKRP